VVKTLFVLLQIMYLGFYVGALANLAEIEELFLAAAEGDSEAFVVLIVTAAILIPVRLFVLSATLFHAPGARGKFLKIWPFSAVLDELWALSPFLLLHHINFGVALACMTPLVYSPFAQRSLVLMGAGGKVRWIGVSNFNVAQMKRVMEIAPITSLQPPYSMLRPAIEAEVLPYVRDNGIGVINYSPMVSGLLTGKMSAERVAAMPADDWRHKAAEFNEPRLSRNLRLVEFLREIGSSHGVTPGVVAVAWTLHNPGITAAIVGGRNAKQVEELSAALRFRLSEDEYAQINAFISSNQA
jgi:hypothetical protein